MTLGSNNELRDGRPAAVGLRQINIRPPLEHAVRPRRYAFWTPVARKQSEAKVLQRYGKLSGGQVAAADFVRLLAWPSIKAGTAKLRIAVVHYANNMSVCRADDAGV